MTQDSTNSRTDWENKTFETLIFESVREQRRSRRWKIFFRFIFLAILGALALPFFMDKSNTPQYLAKHPHVGLIQISGVLMEEQPSNADAIAGSLRKAFEDPGTIGIILKINSPGGSAVQADYVYREITRLRKLYPKTKIYSVCSDICASGAYYIASATDEIFSNPASLVGSIGVVYSGFGFVDGMHKFGIERRIQTSGKHKAFLDPFSPINDQDKQFAQNLLDDIHKQFIEAVKKGRGTRLHTEDPLIFSGLVWTGTRAKNLGLIDGFESAGSVARDIFKSEEIVDYTEKPSPLDQLSQYFPFQRG